MKNAWILLLITACTKGNDMPIRRIHAPTPNKPIIALDVTPSGEPTIRDPHEIQGDIVFPNGEEEYEDRETYVRPNPLAELRRVELPSPMINVPGTQARAFRGQIGRAVDVPLNSEELILDFRGEDDDILNLTVALFIVQPIPGTNLPHFRMEWGTDGFQQFTNELDATPGSIFTLPASFIRIIGVNGAAPGDTVKMGASISRMPYPNNGRNGARLTQVLTIASGATGILQIPTGAHSVDIFGSRDAGNVDSPYRISWGVGAGTVTGLQGYAPGEKAGQLVVPGNAFSIRIDNNSALSNLDLQLVWHLF